MKGIQPVIIAILMAACAVLFFTAQDRAIPQRGELLAGSVDGDITVYFSPGGGCTNAIVEQIARAKTTICVQAYSFTSVPIAKAIVDAHKRGVSVQAVLDKSQRGEKYTSATFLLNAGVPVYIDDNHAIAHNKIILIDGQTIITGSFNFSKAAEESNAENLLIIRGRGDLYAKYERNFKDHLGHSEKYRRAKGE